MNRWFLSLIAAGFITQSSHYAYAESHCGPEALGTLRTLTLKREFVGYGSEQYQRLPLSSREVVLTFDDGPNPDTLDSVLETLAAECVKATFYMTGANLNKHPALARRVVAEGHSVGLHSFAHPQLPSMSEEEQLTDLKKGLQAYGDAFGTEPASYRFPFLAETPTILNALKNKQMTVASMDLGIKDYWPNDMQVEALVSRLTQSLETSGGGILLMHDANAPTAQALPQLLKTIKNQGYKIVHIDWQKDPVTQ